MSLVEMAVIKELEDHAERYEKAMHHISGNNSILAWDNGLAVNFDVNGNPRALNALHATAIDGTMRKDIPEVRNGKGELAKVRLRREVLAKNLEDARSTIEHFKEGLLESQLEEARTH